jgi:hypothetical protein
VAASTFVAEGKDLSVNLSPFHGYTSPVNPGPPPKTIIDSLLKARSKSDLSEREKDFLIFLAKPGKTITLAGFRNFWNSLSKREQYDLKIAFIRK